MLFFEKRPHQNAASVADAPRHSFSATLIHAEDVDEFVEMLRGYRLRFTQIDKGPFVAEAVQTRLAGTLLSAAQYSRALVHYGEPQRDTITFAMGTARVPALWQDRQIEADDLLIVTSGTEIDLVSQPGYVWPPRPSCRNSFKKPWITLDGRGWPVRRGAWLLVWSRARLRCSALHLIRAFARQPRDHSMSKPIGGNAVRKKSSCTPYWNV